MNGFAAPPMLFGTPAQAASMVIAQIPILIRNFMTNSSMSKAMYLLVFDFPMEISKFDILLLVCLT
jgi:hypothetical protein